MLNFPPLCFAVATADIVDCCIAGSIFITSALTVLVTPTAKFKFCTTLTPPPPIELLVSALFLIEPALPGTNNSGPLSPTRVGVPACTVPPLAAASVLPLPELNVGSAGENIPSIPCVITPVTLSNISFLMIAFCISIISSLKIALNIKGLTKHYERRPMKQFPDSEIELMKDAVEVLTKANY